MIKKWLSVDTYS